MTWKSADLAEDRLALHSRLAEIAQVPAWIEDLASRHAIPANLQFAMKLCLEEVLSNIVLHGYRGEEHGSITVSFTAPREGYFQFVVEDEAPRFNPLDAPGLPALSRGEETRIGGHGIRLLRGFADTLNYEPLPSGNRLGIGFSAPTP